MEEDILSLRCLNPGTREPWRKRKATDLRSFQGKVGGVLHAWDHPGLDDVPSGLPVCWSAVSGRAPGKASVVTADLAPSDLAGKGTPAPSTAQSQQGGTASASPKW